MVINKAKHVWISFHQVLRYFAYMTSFNFRSSANRWRWYYPCFIVEEIASARLHNLLQISQQVKLAYVRSWHLLFFLCGSNCS